MLYDYLAEFTVVARTGSLSKAAAELGVSQPALGRHLSALETDLGVALVTRGSHGVAPTAEGRYLLGIGLDICSIGEEIERHFESLKKGSAPRQLYVAGLCSLDAVLVAFRTACERAAGRGRDIGTPLYRSLADLGKVEEALFEQGVDIVVTFGSALDGVPDGARARLHCRKLCGAACIAVVEPGSHLAGRRGIRLEDLRGVRVARPSGAIEGCDLQWAELRKRCLERGFSPLSYTTSFDARPYNGWDLPGCVVLFHEGQIDAAAMERIGKVALPMEDFAYEVWGACRADDALAAEVVDGTAEAMGGEGGIELKGVRDVRQPVHAGAGGGTPSVLRASGVAEGFRPGA